MNAPQVVGAKFCVFIGRWLAVYLHHTKAIYDYYKAMVSTRTGLVPMYNDYPDIFFTCNILENIGTLTPLPV